MITGCATLDVLEAAHIVPFRGAEYDNLENGLLLRSDVHTLFDLDLLGINPASLTVALSPRVAREYAELQNRRLLCDGDQPSRPVLERRWEEFQQKAEYARKTDSSVSGQRNA